MDPVKAFQRVVFEKYADFSGRASRGEYWYFTLAMIGVYIVLVVLSAISAVLFVLAALVVGFGLIIPGIAVGVRRLHDTDRSGWWMLISFVPFVGGIIFLIFMVLAGTPGQNQYGPQPTS